jgi:hypothetical protein
MAATAALIGCGLLPGWSKIIHAGEPDTSRVTSRCRLAAVVEHGADAQAGQARGGADAGG